MAPGVNFINVLHTRFSYESSYKAKTYLEKRLLYVKCARLTLMKLTTAFKYTILNAPL